MQRKILCFYGELFKFFYVVTNSDASKGFQYLFTNINLQSRELFRTIGVVDM